MAIVADLNCIDSSAEPIGNEETLLRLLCSPSYYNEEHGIVNADAFDLRVLKGGSLEEYVSLARLSCFGSLEEYQQYLSTAGYRIWDDKEEAEDHYYGYGIFNCADAREVHQMVEINPLVRGKKSHVGLFYKAPQGGYYCGPLPKDNVEVLEVLSDLADLLSVTVAPPRA